MGQKVVRHPKERRKPEQILHKTCLWCLNLALTMIFLSWCRAACLFAKKMHFQNILLLLSVSLSLVSFEFHQLEKARMREVVNWWLNCQEERINLGLANVKRYDLSRKLLEQYCAKAPTGTDVMRSDGRYIFHNQKIRDFASRHVD